jgi:RHS repeat-associated protein
LFNQPFVVWRSKDNPCRYVYTFRSEDFLDGIIPCDAKDLVLTLREDKGRIAACVDLRFNDPQAPRVSWHSPRVKNCCQIGSLRRRGTNSACCFPLTLEVMGVPIPDPVAPQPEWYPGNPDDLNNAPFWPTMDVDLGEDSREAPVRYFDGELQLRLKDVGSDGLGTPWGHTRIYSNRLSHSYDFGNGTNWLIHEWPRLVFLKGQLSDLRFASCIPKHQDDHTGCVMVLLRGTRNAIWFDEFRDKATSKNEEVPKKWRPRHRAKYTLEHDATKNLYRVVTGNGHVWEFFDFACDDPTISREERGRRASGQFYRHTSPAGVVTEATYEEKRIVQVKREGDGLTETYKYEYPKGDESTEASEDAKPKQLEKVIFSRGGQPVQQALYTYYGEDEDHGMPGDLKTVTVQLWNNGWKSRENAIQYFRYYKESYGTYCQGMLKAFVGPEAFYRISQKHRDPYSVTDAVIRQYADLFVTYYAWDSDGSGSEYENELNTFLCRRVREVSMNGGDRTHYFYYEPKITSRRRLYYKDTAVVTSEVRADDASVQVTTNAIGQTLSRTLSGTWQETWSYGSSPSLKAYTPVSDLKGTGAKRSFDYFDYSCPGGYVEYYLQDITRQDGTTLRHYGYTSQAYRDRRVLHINRITEPATVGGGRSSRVMDRRIFIQSDFHGATAQLFRQTFTLPAVPEAHHGDRNTHTRVVTYDGFGYPRQTTNERGFTTVSVYDAATGALKSLRDAEGQVTEFELDRHGRAILLKEPPHNAVAGSDVNKTAQVRRCRQTEYDDANGQVTTRHGYLGSGGSLVFSGPTEVTQIDRAGRVVSATASGGSLTGSVSVRRRTSQFDDQFRRQWDRVYYGTGGHHYEQTTYQYDLKLRVLRTLHTDGTETVTHHNVCGWPTRIQVNNSVRILEYDHGKTGGLGNVTKITQIAEDGPKMETVLAYDGLNRLNQATCGSRFISWKHNEADDVTQVTQGQGTPDNWSIPCYDILGRVYETEHHRRNIMSGGDDCLVLRDSYWYDPVGNVRRHQPAGMTAYWTYEYDGINRVEEEVVHKSQDDETDCQRTVWDYDLMSAVTHYVCDASSCTSRTEKVTQRYDPLGNQCAVINEGDGSGGKLVTVTQHNAFGEAEIVTDPTGATVRTRYDGFGRPCWINEAGLRQSRYGYGYWGGGRSTTLTVDNSHTGTQTTVSKHRLALAAGSAEPVWQLAYLQRPAAAGAQPGQVQYRYNCLGAVSQRTDENGTTHRYEYDPCGRLTEDRVTRFASHVDRTVDTIKYGYDRVGHLNKIVSFGAGQCRNEVVRDYTMLGQLQWEQIGHSGSAYAQPRVVYSYDNEQPTFEADNQRRCRSNHSRLRKITYPGGQYVTYGYEHPGALVDDVGLSRVQAIYLAGVKPVVSYNYCGLGDVADVLYPEPGLQQSVAANLDAFGRLKKVDWHKNRTSLATVGYDYAQSGVRTSRRESLPGLAMSFDEVYTPDALGRMKSLERGRPARGGLPWLSGVWDLDATDNWKSFAYLRTPPDSQAGLSAENVLQRRYHNARNQITGLTPLSAGARWTLPKYDAAGNTTSIPSPYSPGESCDCRYDAWNRLRQIKRNGKPLLDFEYDGLGRRIIKQSYLYDNLIPSETRFYNYDDQWRVLEERVWRLNVPLAKTPPERAYVWGIRGPNDLVLRLRDTNRDGTLDEKLYALHDANFNTIALSDPSGQFVERFVYDAYGRPFFYDGKQFHETPPNQLTRTSAYDWNLLFGGYSYDAEIGLYDVRHRVYHPLLGRWLQEDPAGSVDSVNLYQYALSSPATYVDPLGLSAGDPLDWAFGSGGLWDVGASRSRLGSFYRASGEGIRQMLGDEYLAQAGGWELIRLTSAAVGAGMLGGWVGGLGAGALGLGAWGMAAVGGAAGGAAEYLTWTLGAEALSGGMAAGPTMGGFVGHTIGGAVGGLVFHGGFSTLGWAGRRFASVSESLMSGTRRGGTLYGEAQLDKLQRYLVRPSRRCRVLLRRNADDFLSQVAKRRMVKEVGGLFRAYPDSTGFLFLRSNPTRYEVLHELRHFIDFRRLGYQAYKALEELGQEQSVYYALQESRNWIRFSQAERDHAYEYILRLGGIPFRRYGKGT